MPVNVKCIFQGGGAKLATLLAAVEALEELENENIIRVTEVAGTSAGAIAAFILAHKRSASELRNKMKVASTDVVNHFSAKPSIPTLIWKMTRGNPIFDEKKLIKFLREVLCEDQTERLSIGDLKIPIHLRASDISSSIFITHSKDSNIVAEQAIADSCALPFAFRTFKFGGNIVDGGIMTNLIDHEIFGDTDEKIIGFSFKKMKPYEFDNFQTYAGTLISASIDSSVREASKKITAAGGYVCELPNDFGTFDFRDALDNGLSDEYSKNTCELTKNQLKDALEEFDRRDRQLEFDHRELRVQKFTGMLFKRTADLYPHSVVSSSIIFIGDSFSTSPNRRGMQPDTLVKDVSIKAESDHLFVFRIGINRTEAYELGKDIDWIVEDKHGVELPCEQEVIESIQEGEKEWHSYFFLEEPLTSNRGPIRVRLTTTHINLMGPLNDEHGIDWMRQRSNRDKAVSKLEFILVLPKSSGNFIMTDLSTNSHRVGELAHEDVIWSGGRNMTPQELSTLKKDYHRPAEFKYIGWTCENVTANSHCGTLIERAR